MAESKSFLTDVERCDTALFERFMSKIEIDPITDCWNWVAGRYTETSGRQKGQKSYGRFKFCGYMWRAHRFSYALFCGEIPAGVCVCHKCDKPRCVNPRHLFLGSVIDNTRDAIQKGRRVNVKGEENGRAKLTEAQVVEIKRELQNPYPCQQTRLAEKYGVGANCIQEIAAGRNWKHIKINEENKCQEVK